MESTEKWMSLWQSHEMGKNASSGNYIKGSHVFQRIYFFSSAFALSASLWMKTQQHTWPVPIVPSSGLRHSLEGMKQTKTQHYAWLALQTTYFTKIMYKTQQHGSLTKSRTLFWVKNSTQDLLSIERNNTNTFQKLSWISNVSPPLILFRPSLPCIYVKKF